MGPPGGDPTFTMFVRRRPTLPQPLDCSTIGAERLNFRVRYGSGCFPFAMAAVTLSTIFSAYPRGSPRAGWGVGCVGWELPSGREHVCSFFCACVWSCTVLGQALGLLVPVGWALLLYTSGLSTPCSVGGLTHLRGGKPHLETCFPLRCIQRLSLPNVANQPCPWRDNWHTRGSSIPVLSY